MNVRDADAGAERRADRLSGDDRLCPSDLRQRYVSLRASAVERRLCFGAFIEQALNATKYCFRERGLRLLSLQLGLLDRHIERHQHRAGPDDLPRREIDVAYRARQLVAQLDGAQREDRSDRGGRLAMLARSRD